MFLHAHSVSFEWPEGGEFSVNTPLPAELAAVLDRLGETSRLRGTTGAGRSRRGSGTQGKG